MKRARKRKRHCLFLLDSLTLCLYSMSEVGMHQMLNLAGYPVWPDIRCGRICDKSQSPFLSLFPGPRGRRRRRIFLIWTCGQLYLDSGSTHPSWSQLRHLLKPFFGILFTVHGKWSYELPVNPLNIFHFWWQSVNNFIIYCNPLLTSYFTDHPLMINHFIFCWQSINQFINHVKFNQCCGAGRAEIILGPGAGAGAKNKF